MVAVKEAWTEHADEVPSGMRAVYFGALSTLLKYLIVEGEALVAGRKTALRNRLIQTSEGAERIEPNLYDAIVVYGLAFSFTERVHRAFERFGTAQFTSKKAECLLSRACVLDMFGSALKRELSIRLVTQIRTISDIPIIVHTKPFRPEGEFRKEISIQSARSSDLDYLKGTLAIFQEAAAAVCAEAGADLMWPEESVCSAPGYTKSEFSLHGLRFNPKEAKGDVHMNKEYGWIVLRPLLARLAEIQSTRKGIGEPQSELLLPPLLC
ncbi:MAG: hypothetical protein JO056_07685 [Alphaproteobacteria bacterium]|nr:hypothetical protein [Alphaproteobacteria bacterium]